MESGFNVTKSPPTAHPSEGWTAEPWTVTPKVENSSMVPMQAQTRQFKEIEELWVVLSYAVCIPEELAGLLSLSLLQSSEAL